MREMESKLSTAALLQDYLSGTNLSFDDWGHTTQSLGVIGQGLPFVLILTLSPDLSDSRIGCRNMVLSFCLDKDLVRKRCCERSRYSGTVHQSKHHT